MDRNGLWMRLKPAPHLAEMGTQSATWQRANLKTQSDETLTT